MPKIESDLEAAILQFFNEVETPEAIKERVTDRRKTGGYGIRLAVAANILMAREARGGNFKSLAQVDEVLGIGPDTMQDILASFDVAKTFTWPTIIGVNWPHGGKVFLDDLKNAMGGELIVRFSEKLREADGDASGINPQTFTVSYLTSSGALEYIIPADSEPPTPRLSDDGRSATFAIPSHLLQGRASIAHSTLFVTLRCDFLLGESGYTVSGAHIGGDVAGRGSGNNTAGGLFESWFYVAATAAEPRPAPSIVKRIYWTDNSSDTVVGVDTDGTNLTTIVSTGPEQSGPSGIAAGGGAVYWGDFLKQTISRADIDGSNAKTIVTGVAGPAGVALDLSAGKMYWTSQDAKKIQRANLDGSAVEDVLTNLGGGSGRGIIGLDIDLSNGRMYWTELSNRVIQRANLDGSGLETIVTEPQGSQPYGIAIDGRSAKVYWADFTRGKIRRSDLDGSNIEDVVVNPGGNIRSVSVDSSDQTLYYSLSTFDQEARTLNYSIMRANLDGSAAEAVVTGVGETSDIALDETGGDAGTTGSN